MWYTDTITHRHRSTQTQGCKELIPATADGRTSLIHEAVHGSAMIDNSRQCDIQIMRYDNTQTPWHTDSGI